MLPAIMFLSLFFGGVCALGGALMITRQQRQDVKARLDQFNAVSRGRPDKAPGRLSEAAAKKFVTQIERFLLLKADHPWETRTSPAILIIAALASAGGAWLLVHRGFGLSILLAAPAAALASYLIPRMLLVRERASIERAFAEIFPDAVDTAARILRAGLPITSAMQTIAREGPPPVNAVFATISNQMKIGMPIEEALRSSSRQIGLADFQFFAVAVTLEQSAGGNLVSTLDVISEIMRKRRAVRLRAQAVTAEIRFSAYILGALPFLTVAALLAIQPNYLTPLFKDPRGHVILGLAAGGLTLCIVTIRHMMRSVTTL